MPKEGVMAGWTLIGNLNGGGLPTGGTLNQFLGKNSATNGDGAWKTLTASMISGLAPVATTGAYSDLTGAPTLGTAASKAVTDIVPTPSASGLVLTSTGSGAYGWATSGSAPVTSVAGKTGAVNLVAADIGGLGTAATTPASAYATAAQGTKADTAVQPAALALVVSSPDGSVTGIVMGPTAPTDTTGKVVWIKTA